MRYLIIMKNFVMTVVNLTLFLNNKVEHQFDIQSDVRRYARVNATGDAVAAVAIITEILNQKSRSILCGCC